MIPAALNRKKDISIPVIDCLPHFISSEKTRHVFFAISPPKNGEPYPLTAEHFMKVHYFLLDVFLLFEECFCAKCFWVITELTFFNSNSYLTFKEAPLLFSLDSKLK